jgi:hypothetical protein
VPVSIRSRRTGTVSAFLCPGASHPLGGIDVFLEYREEEGKRRRQGVREFESVREAKEFLAEKIVAEAEREELVLSEVEQKMLLFSETGWTLPDMARISEEFDRTYNPAEYEATIAALAAQLEARLRAGDEEGLAEWNAAVQKLSEEDHYLSVLVRAPQDPPWRPTGQQVIRILAVLAGVGFLFALIRVWAIFAR